MKVKMKMINKELRMKGRIIKLFLNSFSEKKFRLVHKLLKKRRLKVKDKSFELKEEWITRKDNTKMRVLIFNPKNSRGNVPGVLWFHGGGYAIGSPLQAKNIAKMFIESSNCVVISPDYRMSVEAPYPAALEDGYLTLLWMKENAKRLGLNDSQLFVGGHSAGGGLTVALSLYARDKEEVNIAYQMPLYPMLDDRMNSESMKDNNAPVWTYKSNYYAWKLYLGEAFKTPNVSYYAAPGRAKDYSNLPPTTTFVGDLEPFKDETIQFVKNLKKANVSVDFEIFKGCFHAFEQMCPKAKISKKALSFLTDSFKYATAHYHAKQKIKN